MSHLFPNSSNSAFPLASTIPSPPQPPSKSPMASPSAPSTSPPPNVPPPSSQSPPPPSSNLPPSSTPPLPSPNPPPIPSPNPPASSPPPPSSEPPKNPPPAPPPPQNSAAPLPPPPPISPPPPESTPPQSSPPPKTSPPPPVVTPPPPTTPPSSNSPPKSSSPPPPPPTPAISLPPPPSLVPPPSSPSPTLPPSQVPTPPSGNPTTQNTSSNTPKGSSSIDNGGISTGVVVAIASLLGLILLSLVATAAWCLRKRKKKVTVLNGGGVVPNSLGSTPRPDLFEVRTSTPHFRSVSGSDLLYSPVGPGGLGNTRSWFTYDELVEATSGFSAQNLLGEGGFGSVYKGYLNDGTEVAVKQLKIGGEQGEREFEAEVEIITRIHHRHLVTLVGYCISENRRLLVYDYVPNNTLYFHLHGEGRAVMDWATRLKVATGAARGIAYLHEDCHPRIIHRDIKSSNILLDNNFEARVSDFGLAKLAVDANSHISTRVMGTFGCMAPEYASSGKLTEKSDMFSFGVVLLELITGRKPVDESQPLGEESLVEWARPLLSHALETQEFGGLVDPRLESNYVDREMFRMIEAAAACVRHSTAKRPRAGQVVRAFDGLGVSDLTNGMRVGESALQPAEIIMFRRMAFGIKDDSIDTVFFDQSDGSS